MTQSRRRVEDPLQRPREGLKESLGINVTAFQASVLFVQRNHALTRVATSCRRFAPGSFATRSMRKLGNEF